jgi:hypothetical protein
MLIKYFYYISKNKLDIIEPQIQTAPFELSQISPKFEIAGMSFGVDVQSQRNGSSVQRLLSVLSRMAKKKLLISTKDVSQFRKLAFYHDEADWLHGRFVIKTKQGLEETTPVDCYYLWRLWNDSIILLIGSKENIVGNVGVDTEVKGSSTMGAVERLSAYLESEFMVDETQHEHWLHDSLRRRVNGLSLAEFCVNYLTDLPQAKLNLVFWVMREYDFDRKSDLPGWITTIAKMPYVQQVRLEKCRRVYVGSPLYTALA